MKKLLSISLIALLAIAAQAKETIKIGIVLPLTGNMAQTGEMGRKGALMCINERASSAKFDYKLIFEDDEFVFSRTAMAIKKLKNFDHADVIVTMWGYGSDIALPYLADKPDIIHLNV